MSLVFIWNEARARKDGLPLTGLCKSPDTFELSLEQTCLNNISGLYDFRLRSW